MARKSHGTGNLEQAMAQLIQNQAAFLSHMTEPTSGWRELKATSVRLGRFYFGMNTR